METITNIKNNKLLDEFHGELLGGKIQVSSVRGYPSHPEKKQQDAVGSIVKNENIFLNIVADGVGSNYQSEKASAKIVKDLIKWFEKLDNEVLENIDALIVELQKEIYAINKDIYLKYNGQALTTFALALTVNDKTVIANVGDSTAYTYTGDEDYPLFQLTPIDSWANSIYYEDVRYSIYNGGVSAYLGDRYEDKIHIKIIDNDNQRIILSTDGVTDLISEENFISYFINNTDAKDIVNKALSNPDVEYLDKTEDNISAITIDLPKNKTKTKKII